MAAGQDQSHGDLPQRRHSSDEDFEQIAAFDTERIQVSPFGVCVWGVVQKVNSCKLVFGIQMDQILSELNFSAEIHQKFRQEKVNYSM